MSSSSRSIAAARQKRAGEQSQPMNTSRPVTSISSQGAFAQQQQYQQQMMSKSIPVGSKNVRVAQNRAPMQQQQEQTTKISISNAVGLITLRLGRLENVLNDIIEDGGINNNTNTNTNENSLPPNMKLVTDEVFDNIVNRLNLLESKVINFTTQTEKVLKEISDLKTSIDSTNFKVSSFITETNEKFVDYENALTEIEEKFELDADINIIDEQSEIIDNNEDINEDINEDNEDNEDNDNNDDNSDNNNSEIIINNISIENNL
jgi:hypothetical protein